MQNLQLIGQKAYVEKYDRYGIVCGYLDDSNLVIMGYPEDHHDAWSRNDIFDDDIMFGQVLFNNNLRTFNYVKETDIQ